MYAQLLRTVDGPPKNLDLPVCLAGSTLCTIAANGDVYPCMTLTGYRLGSLLDEPFGTIWQKASHMQEVLALRNFKECIACSNLPICAWCPGHASLEHGDLYAPVQEFCRMTSAIRGVLNNEVRLLHNHQL